METKVSYALVGLFVIFLSMALVGAVLWLTVGTQDKIYDTYVVYIEESVGGLNPKATVRYRGVDVGQVETIQLDPRRPDRVELILHIERGTPIREDTVATLVIQGLTGLASVELSGGDPDATALIAKEGEVWPVIKSSPSLIKRLDDAFNNIVNKIDRLSADLAALLSVKNQQTISATLVNLSTITGAIAERSEGMKRTLINLENVSDALGWHVEDIGETLEYTALTMKNSARFTEELVRLTQRIGEGMGSIRTMANAISKTSTSLDQVVVESRRDLRQLVQRTTPELNTLLEELTRLTDNIQRFVQELDRNPQMLLLGKPAARPGPGEDRVR